MATFMPKPFAHLTGNGCHFHMSLWKDGENVFEADPGDDPNGMGLSDIAYKFIGGLKAHAKAYIAVTAPTVTSYKRLVDGRDAERFDVGAGLHQLRLQQPHADAAHPGGRADRGPHGRRLLQPLPGCDGRARRRPRRHREGPRRRRPDDRAQPPRANDDELNDLGVETLPATLLDAARELEADDVMREALGNTGREDYVDYFAKIKKAEFKAAHEQITQWELDRYLQLF